VTVPNVSQSLQLSGLAFLSWRTVMSKSPIRPRQSEAMFSRTPLQQGHTTSWPDQVAPLKRC